MSRAQRPSWCLSVILACFQCILLRPRILNAIPFAANKPPALWFGRTVQSTHGSCSSMSSSCGMLSKEGCCQRRGFMHLALISGALVSFVLFSLSSSSVVVLYRVSSSYLPSSSTYLERTGESVTVSPKCQSLSLSGYLADVNSCLWLDNVAHAHSMRWSNSTWKVVSWPRFSFSPYGGRISVFTPCAAAVLFLVFDVVLETIFVFKEVLAAVRLCRCGEAVSRNGCVFE